MGGGGDENLEAPFRGPPQQVDHHVAAETELLSADVLDPAFLPFARRLGGRLPTILSRGEGPSSRILAISILAPLPRIHRTSASPRLRPRHSARKRAV